MNRVIKRYLATWALAVAGVAAMGALGAWIVDAGGTKEAGALGGVLIVGSFGTTAALVAREKGRSLWWALSAFIAPLLPIVLLLPHTKARRLQLLGGQQPSASTAEQV